jgi:glycosyltransferase involved in cell wall biosynthesis
VVINPVRFGSGLKIKAVEALAYGRALVSTPVGVEGLDGAGEVFVATPFVGMGRAVAALLSDPARCGGLQRAALAYARQRFAPERCFGELHEYLEKGRCGTL